MFRYSALLLSALISAPAPAAGAEVFEYSGVARNEDGEVLYREYHQVVRDGRVTKRAVTHYYDGRGRAIGSLYTDYSRDRFAPDYRMTDPSGEVLEAAQLDAGALVLRHGDQKVTKRLSPDDLPLVTGQGLHQFLRLNLDALKKGRELAVNFPIPSRGETYEFRIRAADSPRPGVVRVKIEMKNWFLSLIAPALEADYDERNGRLLAYRGISNLDVGDRDNPKVHIDYSYPSEGAR